MSNPEVMDTELSGNVVPPANVDIVAESVSLENHQRASSIHQISNI